MPLARKPLKVAVDGRIRYPDAFVVCTPVAPNEQIVREPVVVFEIMSDGTQVADLVQKNQEYRATPSVRRYVLLEQHVAACLAFSHRNGVWAVDTVIGADAIPAMPEIGCDIPLSEIYEGVEFPSAE